LHSRNFESIIVVAAQNNKKSTFSDMAGEETLKVSAKPQLGAKQHEFNLFSMEF
jgi:hypothetical protein